MTRAPDKMVVKIEARVAEIERLAKTGMRRHAMARHFGYETTGALSHWMRRNAPELYEKYRETRSKGAGKCVPPEEARKRLRVLVMLQNLGLDVRSLATWARHNFPNEDYALALEDYDGGE